MNTFKRREFNTVVIGGAALAGNAGFVNAIALGGLFASTVSHVTGNVTKTAVQILRGQFMSAANTGFLIGCFMLGSFASGIIIGDSKFRLGRRYGYALALESFSFLLSYLLLKASSFSGTYIAAFACGLQNAFASSYSGAVIRTTHMTGICTDIAVIIGQWMRWKNADLWKLKVFIPLLVSYFVGGLFGYTSYLYMKDKSMLIPAAFTGCCSVLYFTNRATRDAQKRLRDATARVADKLKSVLAIPGLASDSLMRKKARELVERTLDAELYAAVSPSEGQNLTAAGTAMALSTVHATTSAGAEMYAHLVEEEEEEEEEEDELDSDPDRKQSIQELVAERAESIQQREAMRLIDMALDAEAFAPKPSRDLQRSATVSLDRRDSSSASGLDFPTDSYRLHRQSSLRATPEPHNEFSRLTIDSSHQPTQAISTSTTVTADRYSDLV